METVADSVARVRTHLLGSYRVIINRLTTTVDQNDSSIELDWTQNSIQRGQVLALGTEEMLVWSYSPGTRTATVERGWNDTHAATHQAGTLVEVNPRYPASAVAQAIKDEVHGWPETMFRVVTQTYTVTASQRTVPVPQAFEEAYGIVRALSWAAADIDVDLASLPDQRKAVRLRRGVHDALSGTHTALYLSGWPSTETKLQIAYALPFDLSGAVLTTDLQDQGIPMSANDLVGIGAALRLMAGADAQRIDPQAQGQTRIVQEVPVGSGVRGMQPLAVLRTQRLAEESSKLTSRWGVPFS